MEFLDPNRKDTKTLMRRIHDAWKSEPLPDKDQMASSFDYPGNPEELSVWPHVFGKRYNEIDMTRHDIHVDFEANFFPDAVFRYYIPAFIIHHLEHPQCCELFPVIQNLTGKTGKERIKLFNEEQREIFADFLQYLLMHKDRFKLDDEEVDRCENAVSLWRNTRP